MNMNCTACSNPIDTSKGYYLVMGAPHCIDCHQAQGDAYDIHTHPPRQESESLLEAFRAYQKRSKAATCHNF
jgi:hypothetical protein